MDLLDLVFEENEVNSDTTDVFFKKLSNYIKNKGGNVTESKLEFHHNNQCLNITRNKEKIVFELIENEPGESLIDEDNIIDFGDSEPYKREYTEEHIPFLKRTLYDMDELTEDEKIEAKKVLATKITKETSIVERLILMIKIKEQIVGRKKRRYYIEDDIFLLNGYATQKEVFAQLIDGKLTVTGGINQVFYPEYSNFDEPKILVERYSSGRLPDSGAYWTISPNFKYLSLNYYLDKKWDQERSYDGVVV